MAIDLSIHETTDSLKTLSNGIYPATITEANFGIAGTGNPRIALTIDIDGQGVVAFGNLTWHTAPSQRYLADCLKATDLMPSGGQLDDSDAAMDALAANLVGKRISAHIAPSMYEGQVSHQVKNYWHADRLSEARRAFAQQQNIVGAANGRTPRSGASNNGVGITRAREIAARAGSANGLNDFN